MNSNKITNLTTPTAASEAANKSYVDTSIPIGGIIMWSGGGGATLPSNWKFCDGTMYGNIKTPDLRNRFVLGANVHADGVLITSDTLNPKSVNGWTLRSTIEGGLNEIGGTKDAVVVEHSHSITDPGHRHQMEDGVVSWPQSGGNWWGYAGGNGQPSPNTNVKKTGITGTNPFGESGSNKNLPPYYALAFIMRIS